MKKYDRLILFVALFFGLSYPAYAQHYECDVTWVMPHPVQKCAEIFNHKLASLSPEIKMAYQKKLEALRNSSNLSVIEDIGIMQKYYPAPEVFFLLQQVGEKIAKRGDGQVLYDDDLASAMPISNYQLDKNIDDIVIEMLIHRPKLTDQESWMLKVSQQRSTCLGNILDHFIKEPQWRISTTEITHQCYK